MTYQPLSLIAELTHRCPLRCVYCSNPLELQARERERATEVWESVFSQAATLGIVQLALTGGEPLTRPDLARLIAHARGAGLYTNLITSGVGLTEARLKELHAAGLDHVQLSFQDSTEQGGNEYAGARVHALKLVAAEVIRKFPVAFTVNIVVHRGNLARLEDMIALAEKLGADRLEIAHVQYYGWALRNREGLLPTEEQVTQSVEVIRRAETRLKGKIKLEFVTPDYYAKFPKACMGGWGQRQLVIDPAGQVLPCHAAMVIPGMVFENVKEKPLREIWEGSEAFNRFRGESWMKAPCQGCDRRSQDYGGCRCQAYLLTGDAAAADPVCSLSPEHGKVVALRSTPATAQAPRPTPEPAAAEGGRTVSPWQYRSFSKK